MTGWEHFQPMADIGVHGFGATPAEAIDRNRQHPAVGVRGDLNRAGGVGSGRNVACMRCGTHEAASESRWKR